jgi:hypothetical protein
VRVDHAAEQRFGEDGDDAADADAQVRETCEARRPAAELAEDDRVRDEAAERVGLAWGWGGEEGGKTYRYKTPYTRAMYTFQKMQMGSETLM